MLKTLGGDWAPNRNVHIRGRTINIFRSIIFFETIKFEEIAAAQIVTGDGGAKVGNVIGGSLAGALLLGPLGAMIGGMASSSKTEQVVAVIFKDGRKVLLQGSPKELMPITAAGFQWESMGVNPPPPPSTFDSEPLRAPHSEFEEAALIEEYKSFSSRAPDKLGQTGTIPDLKPSSAAGKRSFGKRISTTN